MTGASTQTALMTQIVDFVMHGENIDMERLRRALYCQVRFHLFCIFVPMCVSFVSRKRDILNVKFKNFEHM